MLVARTLQGIRRNVRSSPASLAILGDHFQGDARGRAIAAWSAFSALTSTLGPALGGVLIDAFGWRSVFWINVPLVGIRDRASRCVTSAKAATSDAPQALDMAWRDAGDVGLGGITYASDLSQARAAGPRRASSASLFGGIALLVLFVITSAHARGPLVPPSIFAIAHLRSDQSRDAFLYGALSALLLRNAVRDDPSARL